MKLFFEQYPYQESKVNGILDSSLYTEYNGQKVIPYVGYYYAPNIKDENGDITGDYIFILPKVFIIKGQLEGEDKVQDLAFGRYKPEEIIDVNVARSLEKKDDELIFGLSTWLYRAIAHFVERNQNSRITEEAYIQNVVSTRGNEDETFLDIVLSLLKFHKEHKHLFTYITILNTSGKSTINWNKTINKTNAVIRNGVPFYPNIIAKDKIVNIDEDLIVLFYSVLNYLSNKYHYKIDRKLEYKLIRPNKIQQLIDTGKGLRILNSIRRKYFSDELVSLWNLLKVFFDKSHKVATKKYSEEKLLVRSFNIVFEDMIDQLIGDSKQDILDGSLKDQSDGKRIDHIYKDASLIPDSDIYFIGDSKYYKDGNDVDGSAFFKQYTYAKNVIQVCMNIFDGGNGKDKLGSIRYVDEKTEGYNVTPNFFIRGNIKDFDNINYTDIRLENETPKDINKYRSKHWPDRLFDRDTLILQSYNINFLFVLSSYVTNSNDFALKENIHKKFRKDIVSTLNNNYTLYKVKPIELESFIEKHFRRLAGKMFRGNDDDDFIWLAFEKNSINEDADLLAIKNDIVYIRNSRVEKDQQGFFFFYFEDND